jgi:uncharacterized membrane protein
MRGQERRAVVIVVAGAAISTIVVLAVIEAIGRRQPMHKSSSLARGDGAIEARVTIERPIADVFTFYRDFRNLPRFLGDVATIEPLDSATTRWTILGPLGVRVRWTVKVTEENANELISYETVSSPKLRTHWEIHFAPGSDAHQTEVREVMRTPLGPAGRAALALIGKFPLQEMRSNLHRLKEVMETGRVSDTSYSVTGKFALPPNRRESEK